MSVIAREVEFVQGGAREVYHAVQQGDYLAIVARLPDGRIPLVRQYRPAVERFTLELPAGLLESDEDASAACVRELFEETGCVARSITLLGTSPACTGRLSNMVHSCFIEANFPQPDFAGEPGLSVSLVTPSELVGLIRAGEFDQQLHLGALLLAELNGYLTLPR
jgi:8-oxo-dGTP pyrophosphatase MutT (NUDIX family)